MAAHLVADFLTAKQPRRHTFEWMKTVASERLGQWLSSVNVRRPHQTSPTGLHQSSDPDPAFGVWPRLAGEDPRKETSGWRAVQLYTGHEVGALLPPTLTRASHPSQTTAAHQFIVYFVSDYFRFIISDIFGFHFRYAQHRTLK